MQEYVDVLKECGIGKRKAEKMAIDLQNSLKKRGVKIQEDKPIKKDEKIFIKKDVIEIDDTYLKEDEEEVSE